MPNIKQKDVKQTYSNINKDDRKTPKLNKVNTNSSIKTQKNEKSDINININNNQEIKLELVGQSVNILNNAKKNEDKEKDKFTFNDQKESILLRPIPDNFFGNNEMKELAGLISSRDNYRESEC